MSGLAPWIGHDGIGHGRQANHGCRPRRLSCAAASGRPHHAPYKPRIHRTPSPDSATVPWLLAQAFELVARPANQDPRVIRLLEVLLHGGSHVGGWSATRWCMKPWESTVSSSELAISWHAEVSGTLRNGGGTVACGMTRSGDWRAWRSTDLFGNSHRDRAYASPGVPPTAASD
jgi:hypothetical protein